MILIFQPGISKVTREHMQGINFCVCAWYIHFGHDNNKKGTNLQFIHLESFAVFVSNTKFYTELRKIGNNKSTLDIFS